MKILLVALDPNKKLNEFLQSSPNYEALQAVSSARAADFTEFLKANFEHVDVVYGEQYKEEMSNDVDVTIFDDAPPKIANDKASSLEWTKDELSGTTTLLVERCLSEGFDKPALFIGDKNGAIGGSINSLIDNLCVCLGAHGFNFNLESQLFKTPNDLTAPTYEVRKTPEHFRIRLEGLDLGDTMEMCRMQTADFHENTSLLPGEVSKNWGLAEYPDAEVFAGGDNAKGVTAVSLSRHGNFFQWGFGVSPSYLTDFAKSLLINAIHYIAKFSGEKTQTRRLKGIFSRNELKELFWMVGDEGYAVTEQNHLSRMNDMREKALAKKEQNLELTPQDEAMINATEFDKPPRNPYLPRFSSSIVSTLGENYADYPAFYNDNIEFIWATGQNQFQVDEDIKSLGLSNREVASLNSLIVMLEEDKNTELASTLLKRYTAESFTEASEWRSWFDEKQHNLFFSDLDGYIFVEVNTL